jgi:glucose-6-phosphate 1-dehydrogenase
MSGDGALFTREDAVEAAWAVVDPVLDTHPRALPYKRRGWGPQEAQAILAPDVCPTLDACWNNPAPGKS